MIGFEGHNILVYQAQVRKRHTSVLEYKFVVKSGGSWEAEE